MSTATKPSGWIPAGIAGLGVGFLLAGILLNADDLRIALAGPTPRNPEQLRLGAQLFKLCLAVDGIVLLGGALLWRRKRQSKRPYPTGEENPLAPLFAEPPASRISRTAARRLLLLCLLVGAGLRGLHLNNDLWLDEIGSLVSYMRLPFGQIVTNYLTPNQHLLYSLLGHVSLTLFGESAAAVRLPAALFGVAGIWSVYRLARLTESRTDALLVAALLTLSYHHIFFSQNARGYTLFLLLAVIGTVLFIRALTTNRTTVWAGYVVVTVLNMFNHLNAVFIFLGQIGTYGLILLSRRRSLGYYGPMVWRALGVSLLIGFLTFHLYAWVLPEMVTFYATADRTGVGWSLLSADFFKEVAKGLSLGFASGLAVLAVLGICMIGTVSYFRQHFWIGVVLALPSLFGVLTVWLMRVGTYPRFFLFALPIAFIMLVRGARAVGEWTAARLNRPALATAWVGLVVAGALGVSGLSLIPYYRMPKQDFTGALAFIHRSQDGTEPIMAADMAAVCAQYYDPTVKAAKQASDIDPWLRAGQPVWLIYIFPASIKLRRPALYHYIDERFSVVRRFPGTVGDGTVYVCRSKEVGRAGVQ